MDNIYADALLREALALLNARPIVDLQRRAAVRRRDLASRIARYLQSRSSASLADYYRARALVMGADYIRLDTPEPSGAGSWVPAWIQLPPLTATGQNLARIEDAIAKLPPMTRNVFLAHRDRELDYAAIATEFGIDVSDVQRLLSEALISLDEAVNQAGA